MKRDMVICVRLNSDEHNLLCALREWLESQSVGHNPTFSDAMRMSLILSARLPQPPTNHAKQKADRTH